LQLTRRKVQLKEKVDWKKKKANENEMNTRSFAIDF